MSEFADKVRTLSVRRSSGKRVVVVRDMDGRPVGAARRDEVGNIVTEYDNRQDVTIQAATVQVSSNVHALGTS
jgi:hypothetical protein